MTTPPGKIGMGAYGAVLAGPGAGTPRGAGNGGKGAREGLCAMAPVIANTTSDVIRNPTLCACMEVKKIGFPS